MRQIIVLAAYDALSIARQTRWIIALLIGVGVVGTLLFLSGASGPESRRPVSQIVQRPATSAMPAFRTCQDLKSSVAALTGPSMDRSHALVIKCGKAGVSLEARSLTGLSVLSTLGVLSVDLAGHIVPVTAITAAKSRRIQLATMVWFVLLVAVMIPVRMAGLLIPRERHSGHVEWLVGNQVSPVRYLSAKAMALGAVSTLVVTAFIADLFVFVSFVIERAASGPGDLSLALAAQGVGVTEGAGSAAFALHVAATMGWKVAPILLCIFLLGWCGALLASGLYMTSKAEIVTATVVEFGISLVFLAAPLVDSNWAISKWLPIASAYGSLRGVFSEARSSDSFVLVAVHLTLLFVLVYWAASLSKRMHWSHNG